MADRINIARAILRFGGDKRVPKSIEAQVLPDSPGGFIAGINYGGENDEEGQDEDQTDGDLTDEEIKNKSKLTKYKNRQAIMRSLLQRMNNAPKQ